MVGIERRSLVVVYHSLFIVARISFVIFISNTPSFVIHTIFAVMLSAFLRTFFYHIIVVFGAIVAGCKVVVDELIAVVFVVSLLSSAKVVVVVEISF